MPIVRCNQIINEKKIQYKHDNIINPVIITAKDFFFVSCNNFMFFHPKLFLIITNFSDIIK